VRSGSRIAAVAATAFVVAAAAVPSYGVQTSRFSLTTGDSRTALVHAPGDGAVTDAVVVGNRTDQPIELSLNVIEETRNANGTFEPGEPGAGLAADVTLETRSVRLEGGEQRTVTVTIDRPSSIESDQWAAITARAASSGDGNGFGVTEQLALLVGITKDAPPEPGDGNGSGDVVRWMLVGVAVLLLTGAAAAWARRR
jgi:hypothetical protein